jgi:hypothetical protein
MTALVERELRPGRRLHGRCHGASVSQDEPAINDRVGRSRGADELQAPSAARSGPRRSCIHGERGGSHVSLPRARRCPRLTALCRTTVGAAVRSDDLSRVRRRNVRQTRSPQGLRGRTVRNRSHSPQPGRPTSRSACDKPPANRHLLDGRGWFRTSDLSRVKSAEPAAVGLGLSRIRRSTWRFAALAQRC